MIQFLATRCRKCGNQFGTPTDALLPDNDSEDVIHVVVCPPPCQTLNTLGNKIAPLPPPDAPPKRYA